MSIHTQYQSTLKDVIKLSSRSDGKGMAEAASKMQKLRHLEHFLCPQERQMLEMGAVNQARSEMSQSNRKGAKNPKTGQRLYQNAQLGV